MATWIAGVSPYRIYPCPNPATSQLTIHFFLRVRVPVSASLAKDLSKRIKLDGMVTKATDYLAAVDAMFAEMETTCGIIWSISHALIENHARLYRSISNAH